MLGSAEPKVSPRRIQIGFPSSEKKKRKKKKFLYLNSYFPYNPFSPRLMHGALFRQRFDVCATWSKIAQLGSYPGIIKCPWVLASALHNWREEGGGSKWQCTVLWLRCRVAGECHRSSQQALTEETEGGHGERWDVGGAIALFTTHHHHHHQITTPDNGTLSSFLHLLPEEERGRDLTE